MEIKVQRSLFPPSKVVSASPFHFDANRANCKLSSLSAVHLVQLAHGERITLQTTATTGAKFN